MLWGSEGPDHPTSTTGKKTICGACGQSHRSFYDRKTRRIRDLCCGDTRIYLEVEIRRVFCRSCGSVKQERLAWISDNPFYTKRFAFYVGRRCRTCTLQDVAKELVLDWKTVKELDKQYMQEQLRRIGTPGPRVIGIDEISIRKGHSYRIVVSDLIRRRPIWFGGEDRSEESMDAFYQWLGPKKSKRIRLAVMDMWKAFRNSTGKHASNAAILFDKFHVLRHLGKALDKVRKSEYARLSGQKRAYIKGQKYTLLSHRENLTLDGRKALTKLLAANKRLNTAYLLKESFSQLWDYEREGWARKFFENWKASLKWQRLKPYEDFAEMIDRHWDGIAAYCQPENKVALGFVEGLNNKIRVLQRRAYGLRDEEYLRLKILTCMLSEL
ncbi:MAG: ISL3 family transposase (plasmid) [Candidatus Manganitrophus sp.]|nr:MAG: ISL3 family transposase [Candidatus Manganitrophus sp.]